MTMRWASDLDALLYRSKAVTKGVQSAGFLKTFARVPVALYPDVDVTRAHRNGQAFTDQSDSSRQRRTFSDQCSCAERVLVI